MRSNKNRKIVQMAILTAIIAIMSLTSLGYVRVLFISITFMMLPVTVGAVVIGPLAGGILGGIFGLSSFLQCFGADPFGTFLATYNPVYAAVVCFVPRILMGVLCGFMFNAMKKIDKTNLISYAVTSVAGAFLNTVLFTLSTIILFGHNTDLLNVMADNEYIKEPTMWGLVITFITVNAVLESIVCLFIGTPICKALNEFNIRQKQ